MRTFNQHLLDIFQRKIEKKYIQYFKVKRTNDNLDPDPNWGKFLDPGPIAMCVFFVSQYWLYVC